VVTIMAKKKAARKNARRTGGTRARRASAKKQASSRRQSAAGRGSRGQQDAISLLKQDHREVEQLLKQFESARSGKKEQIAGQICAALTAHAQIEEELLYPAAREALKKDDEDLVDEADVEHASVKNLIAQIEAEGDSDPLFEAKVKVMGEFVKHHVKEEENELFPKLRKTGLDLEALGEQLATRKAELLSGDGAAAASASNMDESDEEDSEDSDMTPLRSGDRSSSRPTAARNS
jgi:hemerythrin superfamily protein